jgi:hypothetical protein
LKSRIAYLLISRPRKVAWRPGMSYRLTNMKSFPAEPRVSSKKRFNEAARSYENA